MSGSPRAAPPPHTRGLRRDPCARRLAGVLAPALAAALLPARAAADAPRTASLAWVRDPGAETCTAPRALAQAVDRLLGRPAIASPAHADTLVEGTIAPIAAGQGFRARLVLTHPDGALLGTRDLETSSADCRALDEQIALVIALLIDPNAVLARPPVAPAAAPAVPAAPPAVPAAPSAAAPVAPSAPSAALLPALAPVMSTVPVAVPCPPPPAPARRWRAGLDAGGVVAAGLLPGAGIGLSLRAQVTPPWLFPIEAGAVVWASARAETGGKGADLSLAWGTLALCPFTWETGGTRLHGCAGGAVGALRAAGFGFRDSSTREEIAGAFSLGARVTQRIVGPLQAAVGVAVLAPLQRARVVYVDAGGTERELFRGEPAAALVDAAIGLAFP